MQLLELLKDLRRYLRLDPQPKRGDLDDPNAPFAMVGAPLKPRPPLGRSSIAIQPEQ